MITPSLKSHGYLRSTNALRFGVIVVEGLQTIFAGASVAVLFVVFSFLGIDLIASGVNAAEGDQDLAKASDLFQTTKVWTLHLRFTPEQWGRMEPEGGSANPFDMSGFGLGMFLLPAVMRDADTNKDDSLTSAEFRALAEQWFAAWDRDADGVLDPKQIREGLKGALVPPGQEGGDGSPSGMMLQGRKGKRNGLSGMMGVDFNFVHADLEFEGRAFRDVAVRYKGNGTFMESRGTLKRPVKIDLNKFVKGHKLAGVTTLNLHNNVSDAGMMNEVMAFWLYRDAAVPAPRTAYARVFVTVPGKHAHQYFGLYSLVENVDKGFLAERGLGKEGAIFKPSMPEPFAYQGDNWDAYEQGYDPKTPLSDAQKRRVIEFSRLVSKGSDEDFAARLGEYLDLDAFARFMAVTVWIGDLDSILTTGQNYYVYLDSKTGRFQFIPWDKDHTFGAWIAGTREEREQHSIREPWEGRKRFLDRAFKVEAFRKRYFAAMQELNEKHAQPEQIEKYVSEIAAAIRGAVKEESSQKVSRFDAVAAGKPLPGNFFGLGTPTATILMFAKGRTASVKDQLAGKSEGHVFGRRKPGDAKAPEGPPLFEEMIEPALVKALDTDKDKKISRDEFVGGFSKWFLVWDSAKAGKLTDDQVRKGLNKALPFSFFGPARRDSEKPIDGGKPGEKKAK